MVPHTLVLKPGLITHSIYYGWFWGRPSSDPVGRIIAVNTSRAVGSSQVVEMSTALPDVVLKEGSNWTNITFQGKGFAWVNHPENQAMIKAHYEEREALLATAPGVYEPGWTTSSSAWVKVRLELADPEEVFELLEEAWRMTATKRAIKAYEASGVLSCNLQSATTRGPAHS
jgi:hypothetical protein